MVYLIHFEKPFKGTQHYVGYTANLEERFKEHCNGTGAKILKAVSSAGIKFHIVRVWPGDRKLERKIKNQKNTKRYCPVCSGEKFRDIEKIPIKKGRKNKN